MNGSYAVTAFGVETHDLDWFAWADQNGVAYRQHETALEAYRDFWRAVMPAWPDAQVESAAKQSAWPFAD